jgi:ankyrin repeat protein
MTTRKHKNPKNKKNKRTNSIFRKTRSKKQRGSGTTCSRPGYCFTEQNNIEEVDPNTIDEYLALAIQAEAPNQVKQYLNKGANPNITILDEHPQISEEVPIIIYAARHIQPSTILRHLLQKHIILDDIDTPLLIEATEWGNLTAVEYLLDLGADINATTHTGATAIGFAVMNEDIPMIELMLDKRRGEIDFNYTFFGTEHENVIDETAVPEIKKILKKYAIEQRLPIHLKRQRDRVNLGNVMRKVPNKSSSWIKRKMPLDITRMIEGEKSATKGWDSVNSYLGGRIKRKSLTQKN